MGYGVYEDKDAAELGVYRWAGYEVPGICDEPGCHNELKLGRGLGNKCELAYVYVENDGDDEEVEQPGCGLYFCDEHLNVLCSEAHRDIKPKPDTLEWQVHMLTDQSWEQWREKNPERVSLIRSQLEEGEKHGR